MQKYLLLLMTLCCISLTSCSGRAPIKQNKIVEDEQESSFVDLDESTQIIVELLRKNDLSTILEAPSAEELDLLIKNFSPAEMAFEAEVLNKEIPVGVFFYQDAEQKKEIKALCDALAPKYEEIFKFVAVPATQFFKLTEKTEIETFPAFLIIHDRKEVGRLEGDLLAPSIEHSILGVTSSNT